MTDEFSVLKTYVMHCRTGYESRGDSIRKQFAHLNLPFEFMFKWDREEAMLPEADRYFAEPLPPVLRSLCLKHFEAWKRCAESEAKWALILEDDILFGPTFRHDLLEILEEASTLPAAHAIYLSNSGNRYVARSERKKGRVGQRVFLTGLSRASDCYLVSTEACRRRVAWVEQHRMTHSIDHQLNRIDSGAGVSAYWVYDEIAEQGSMTGVFASSINAARDLNIKRVRWMLDKFYKKHVLRNLR